MKVHYPEQKQDITPFLEVQYPVSYYIAFESMRQEFAQVIASKSVSVIQSVQYQTENWTKRYMI